MPYGHADARAGAWMAPPHVVARLRSVPTRAFAAVLSFGGMLGVPALLVAVGVLFVLVDLAPAAIAAFVLAFVVLVAAAVAGWVVLFRARTALKRAEQALYAGDFDAATREAHFVVKFVFRADYQTGALFTLALAAERLGAFADAGALFMRALDMIPAMAAQRPGRRARALFAAHAALSFAAAGDLARANAMLAHSHAQLGLPDRPGGFDVLLDDSSMGAIGINTMLVELESGRDPRPLAVLASVLVAFKHGHVQQALALAAHERQSLEHGLAPHERALAHRIETEALRLASGGGPHRSPGPVVTAAPDLPSTWAALVVPSGH